MYNYLYSYGSDSSFNIYFSFFNYPTVLAQCLLFREHLKYIAQYKEHNQFKYYFRNHDKLY